MRSLSLLAAIALSTLAFNGVTALAAPRGAPVIVVDDDRAQCPGARFRDLQTALDAAPGGAIVRICAGTYAGPITVRKGLTLRGATPARVVQACADPGDARASRVTGGIQVTARNVTVSGLVVAGPAATGIATSSSASGYLLARNMLAGNAVGVRLETDGSDWAGVIANCFLGNNAPGAVTGVGVYSGTRVDNIEISHNVFRGQAGRSIWLAGAQQDLLISLNTLFNDGSIEVGPADGLEMARNVVLGASGPGFLVHTGVHDAEIVNNHIEEATGAGIAFAPTAGGRPNIGISVLRNTIIRSTGDGVQVAATTGIYVNNNLLFQNAGNGIALLGAYGTDIKRNLVESNGTSGIFADGATRANNIESNLARGNTGDDCHDDSRGDNTGGTANFWDANAGTRANRQEICIWPAGTKLRSIVGPGH